MLRDLLFNFFHCATPGCVIWNIIYLFGVYLLGLWMAHQIWVRPWRRHWTDGREGAYQRVSASTVTQEPKTLFDEEDAGREEEPVGPVLGQSEEEDTDEEEDETSYRNAALGAAGLVGVGAALAQASKEEDEDREIDEIPDSDDEELARQQIDLLRRKYGDEELRNDPLLGVIYDDPPVKSDDLTRIDGIGMGLEGDLNDLGVHRLEQIANWSPKNTKEFSKRLHLGEQINDDDWVSQARHLVGLNGGSEVKDVVDEEETEEDENVETSEQALEDRVAEEVDRSEVGPTNDFSALIAAKFANEHVEADPDLGVVYLTTPEVDDDLTEIETITGDVERSLNHLGVHRFAQIAHWTDRQVKEFSDRLGVAQHRIEDEDWVSQADRLYHETYRASKVWSDANPSLEEYEALIDEDYQGEQVRADGLLGVLYTSRPDDSDELTEIDGVSDLMSQWLQDSGVFKFKQIADWSEMNVTNFADRLDLPKDRIFSERWIPQAQELAAKAQFKEIA
tara:strand:+ start:22546 stop:24066 length:1521 start_codon:yes stop_codon:yes gene_type:complete